MATLTAASAGVDACEAVSPSSDDERDAALRAGAARLKPVRRCSRVALWSSITLIGFGGMSLLFALLSADPSGLTVGAVVVVIGLVEARLRGQLEHGDLRAPKRLALNQLCLILAATVYCLTRLLASPEAVSGLVFSPETSSALADAEGSLATMGADLEVMASNLVKLVYGSMLVVVWLAQGLLALYYARKSRALAAYLDETPEWVRATLEALD